MGIPDPFVSAVQMAKTRRSGTALGGEVGAKYESNARWQADRDGEAITLASSGGRTRPSQFEPDDPGSLSLEKEGPEDRGNSLPFECGPLGIAQKTLLLA